MDISFRMFTPHPAARGAPHPRYRNPTPAREVASGLGVSVPTFYRQVSASHGARLYATSELIDRAGKRRLWVSRELRPMPTVTKKSFWKHCREGFYSVHNLIFPSASLPA